LTNALFASVTGVNQGIRMPSQGRDPESDYILHNHPPNYLAVPFNLTVGFNFTAGRRGFRDKFGPIVEEYPRCPFSSFTLFGPTHWSNEGQNPSCYCLTARCIQGDETSGRFDEGWTVTSTVTFFPDFNTFRMGVTPNTQHHSPRIFAPAVMYLPLLQPQTMGTNFTFRAIEGADEDGSTTLEWSTGAGSILQVSKDGTLMMPPLAIMTNNDGQFTSDQPWVSGWPEWYKWFTWRVRVNAIDKATDPLVFTSVIFSAKLCTKTLLKFVPITHDNAGVRIAALGDVQTIYVKDWGPSCVHNQTRRRLDLENTTQADCLAVKGDWMGNQHFYTKPDKEVVCHVEQPCSFELHSVRLDFTSAGVTRCKWSDQPILAGERYCHELTMGPYVVVSHDAFHVSYTGEHEHGENSFTNPGKILIKPFQGRRWSKNPYTFDIGRREVFCLSSKSNDTDAHCPSLPHCVTVVVKGRAPIVTSPKSSDTCAYRTKNDASEYLQGQCPDLYACWRSDTVSEITLAAEDEDAGETVTIVVDSISTYTRYSSDGHNVTEIAYPKIEGSSNGGVDINDHCRARAKDPNEDPPSRFIPVTSMSYNFGGGGTPPLATVGAWNQEKCGSVIRKVTFKNDYLDNGLSPLETKVTPTGHRYSSVKNDSVICYTVSDNQAEVWGRGVNNKYSYCHIWRLRGAPVFQYSPQFPLDTPFGGANQYDIGLTETTLTSRLSEMVSFTFRARDPNPEDTVSILFLEDPGIPNEAVSLHSLLQNAFDRNLTPSCLFCNVADSG
jgi:hypothetical protein